MLAEEGGSWWQSLYLFCRLDTATRSFHSNSSLKCSTLERGGPSPKEAPDEGAVPCHVLTRYAGQLLHLFVSPNSNGVVTFVNPRSRIRFTESINCNVYLCVCDDPYVDARRFENWPKCREFLLPRKNYV